jgi:hypothetical protein
MSRLTRTGWLVLICTLGLAYPLLAVLRPRNRRSSFQYTGEYLSKFKR